MSLRKLQIPSRRYLWPDIQPVHHAMTQLSCTTGLSFVLLCLQIVACRSPAGLSKPILGTFEYTSHALQMIRTCSRCSFQVEHVRRRQHLFSLHQTDSTAANLRKDSSYCTTPNPTCQDSGVWGAAAAHLLSSCQACAMIPCQGCTAQMVVQPCQGQMLVTSCQGSMASRVSSSCKGTWPVGSWQGADGRNNITKARMKKVLSGAS